MIIDKPKSIKFTIANYRTVANDILDRNIKFNAWWATRDITDNVPMPPHILIEAMRKIK